MSLSPNVPTYPRIPARLMLGPEPELTTEHVLIAVFRGPIVRLTDISQGYFGLSREEAVKAAVRGELPIPAFRLRDSQKAPLLVTCAELARLIDQTRAKFNQDLLS